MTTNDIKIDAYLRRVRAGLSGLPQSEVTDILNELRAHIVERAESGGGPSDNVVEAVLRSMGTPEQISALLRLRKSDIAGREQPNPVDHPA